MGLPSRSLAADADHCIMVQVRTGPTEYKCVARCPRPMASSPRMISVTAKPVDMWTIGVADRLGFPRFPSKLEKRGNARLRPHTHIPTGTQQTREIDINGTLDAAPPAVRRGPSNHLTPKAPYKPAPGLNRGATAGVSGTGFPLPRE